MDEEQPGIHDVVDDHHRRNRFPVPPDPSTLRNVHLQQEDFNTGGPRSANRPPSRISSVQPDTRSIPSRAHLVQPLPSQPRSHEARSRSPEDSSTVPQVPSVDTPSGPLSGPATKLRSYPSSFRAVIERAKLIAQCDCAAVNPFPARPEFLDRKSVEYFNEAFAETTNVPQGKWNLGINVDLM